MDIENIFKEIFAQNIETLQSITQLNTLGVVYAITGSSALYIHGGFGRQPNDLDIYTTESDLYKISKAIHCTIGVKNFPPVSWTELQGQGNTLHILATLSCDFENDTHFDFSFSPLLKNNLSVFTYFGTSIYVVPAEEVLLLKLTAPRKTDSKDDILDVENYLKTNSFHKDYFVKRANEIGVYDIVSCIPSIQRYLS